MGALVGLEALVGAFVWQKLLGLGGSFGLVGAFGLGQFGWELWLSGSLVWQKIFWIRWEPFGLGGSFWFGWELLFLVWGAYP